jgi:hypothetical protein
MNFKKEILIPFRKILVLFRTTQDWHSCRSLLLVWQICSLNWDLDMDSFVWTLCISFDGPVAKYLLVMQGMIFITFSWWHPWEPRFKSGFYNSFWDYLVPDRISWMTVEICKWNLGTSFGYNSFSGIHKSKIICSVLNVHVVFFGLSTYSS